MAKDPTIPPRALVPAHLKLNAFLDAEIGRRDTSVDQSIESCALLPMSDIEADADEVGIDLMYKMDEPLALFREQREIHGNAPFRCILVDDVDDISMDGIRMDDSDLIPPLVDKATKNAPPPEF